LAVPLLAKGQLQGVLELYARARLDPGDEWLEFLETYADQGAIAIENSQLLRSLERSNVELQRAYDRTIEGWAFALDLKDEETAGHSKRVTDMAVWLARSLGMSTDELIHLQRGALLHDIGKMGIPDSILLKGEELTDDEYELMKRHPVYAYELLSPIEFLRPALDIPYCHHERWDGQGYPRGLAGEGIPLAARIFAVVDVFDALTSDRPYRPAWPRERALAYLRAQSGRHFDPTVVEAFFKVSDTP
ncbi:MAG TPA: HD-GYP domain-containing protein, partial [Trueperaceae bacterium]|nr:HD-GYP domain-containing protein [Trueperaceae bacterium]